MFSYDLPNHVYITLLFLGVAAAYLLMGRSGLGAGLRRTGLYAIFGLAALLGTGVYLDVQNGNYQRELLVQGGGEIVLNRNFDGHFYATLEVNGVPVRMVVDTGATDLVLTQEDARRIGLDPDNMAYTERALTANGSVDLAPVRLDSVVFDGLERRAVSAVVNGGEMFESLLGMSYLNTFESIEMRGRELILRP